MLSPTYTSPVPAATFVPASILNCSIFKIVKVNKGARHAEIRGGLCSLSLSSRGSCCYIGAGANTFQGEGVNMDVKIRSEEIDTITMEGWTMEHHK